MKNIDEITYDLFPDDSGYSPVPDPVEYGELAKRVYSDQIKEHIFTLLCDTPIRYNYKGRTGFITVEDFLIRGQRAHYVLIENSADNFTFIIHPNLADTALRIERNRVKEKGKDPNLVQCIDVSIPKLQIDINEREYYVW